MPGLGIRAKITLPWVVLLIGLLALTALHEYLKLKADDSSTHARLHRDAFLLAHELQDLSQERWMRAQAYRVALDPHFRSWLAQSYEDTNRILGQLERLFSNSPHQGELFSADESGALESYRLTIAGHMELYERFISAIDAGDAPLQQKLQELLDDKLRLVIATQDDLNQYHIKTARQVDAQHQVMLQQADLWFIGAMLLLIGAGLLLAFLQSRAVVRPVTELTLAARRIEAGESPDLGLLHGKDEIGELAEALERMVAELKRANEEIAAAYAAVEDKVRVRTRELAHRTVELELANRDLEGFSYSVSHDLRAPLRAIDGFIAILIEDYGETLDDEAQRLFGIVADNARRMGDLIDDILAFSRAGRLELSLEQVDMNALVDAAWAELAPARGERDIEFRRDDLPPVRCDPRALRQVWQNLLDNAIKFTRNRQPARIAVSALIEDGHAVYSVADNGAGFNPAYQDKLFGLFQRLHGMDEFPGTGVGLCLVKRFVQKHRGTVMAEGNPDGGARFSFSLPLDPENDSILSKEA